MAIKVLLKLGCNLLRQSVILAGNFEVEDIRSIMVIDDTPLAESEVVIAGACAEEHAETVSEGSRTDSTARLWFVLVVLII